MTIRYANPAGSNTSPYDTLAKGATDPQTILDLAEAGDECRLYGTFTHGSEFTGPLTIDTNTGSATTGFIKVVGVNSSGDNDGTLAVIDGNDAGGCLAFAGKTCWWFENLDVKRSSGSGVDDGAATILMNSFINCRFHNCASNGFDGYRFSQTLFFRCAFYSNTGSGLWQIGPGGLIIFSSFHDNGSDGILHQYGSGGVIFGSLIYDNGGYGINDFGAAPLLNCVVNGNTNDGVEAYSGSYYYKWIFFNRFTNHPAGKYGLDFQSMVAIHGYNYFEDNAGGNITGDTYVLEVLYNGVGTNDEDNADTNEGYTSKTNGSEDFNLSSTASMRRTAITIPLT